MQKPVDVGLMFAPSRDATNLIGDVMCLLDIVPLTRSRVLIPVTSVQVQNGALKERNT